MSKNQDTFNEDGRGEKPQFFLVKRNFKNSFKNLLNLELLYYNFTKCSREKVRKSEKEEQWKKNNLLKL